MANGELMEQLQKLLEGENTIPQGVTNALVLGAVRQVYREVKELKETVDKIQAHIDLDKEKDSQNLTWLGVRDNVVLPIFRTLLTLGLGYIFFRIFGSIQ